MHVIIYFHDIQQFQITTIVIHSQLIWIVVIYLKIEEYRFCQYHFPFHWPRSKEDFPLSHLLKITILQSVT